MQPPNHKKLSLTSGSGEALAAGSTVNHASTSRWRVSSKQVLELAPSIVAAVDALVIVAISILTAYVVVDNLASRLPEYLIVTGLSAVSVISVFNLWRLYSLRALTRLGHRVPRIVMTFSGLLLVLTTVFFALKISAEFSRAWLFSWLTISPVAIVTVRSFVARLLSRWADSGILSRKVIILGAGQRGRALLKEVRNSDVPRIQVVGFFDDRVQRYGDAVDGVPVLGQVRDLIDYLRNNPGAEIMITLPWSATDRIRHFTRELAMLPVDVNLIPDSVVSDFQSVTFQRLGSLPILQVSRQPISGWKSVFKWIEDRIVGGIITLLAAPAILLIGLAVKLTSPGPVFFRQKRYGFNNNLITVYKFRTMYTHLSDANANRLTAKDDERVTPLGRLLRKTSLDELPQLLNVLKGEMSLVGPRPHATAAKADDRLYEDVASDYAARHRVKPGITGWAQVHGWRGETDTYEKLVKRVEFDLYYIENYSLCMDVQILFKTIYVCLKRDNAY